MFRRCVTKAPRPQPASVRPACDPHRSLFHHSSSTSQQSRKLPGSDSVSKLKPWQKALLVGASIGLLASQTVLYYRRQYTDTSFVNCTLIARDPVSDTASVLRFKPNISSEEFQKYQRAWESSIWNVQIKQPQIQIVRAYTPLPPLHVAEENATPELRFLIRHDLHGEVSSYLSRLPVGSSVELRGPNIEYQIAPDTQQVVFFAGGTGIAPALQVAHAMFNRRGETGEKSRTSHEDRKLHILWANRQRDDCRGGVSDVPIIHPASSKAVWPSLFSQKTTKSVPHIDEEKGLVVQELENLKRAYPGQITVDYFVNAEDTWINEDAVLQSLSRFEDTDFSTNEDTSRDRRQILISGPSGFISYLAGPKEWRHGKEEQGHVSKIIAHAIAQNPHHVKVWKI